MDCDINARDGVVGSETILSGLSEVRDREPDVWIGAKEYSELNVDPDENARSRLVVTEFFEEHRIDTSRRIGRECVEVIYESVAMEESKRVHSPDDIWREQIIEILGSVQDVQWSRMNQIQINLSRLIDSRVCPFLRSDH
jgi:hypothetical protein